MRPSSLVAVRQECRPCQIQNPVKFTARQGPAKLPAGDYLSMNVAAWQPLRTAPQRERCVIKSSDKAARCRNYAGMMPDMAVPVHVARKLRVLLSEGNSTSARE